MGAKADSQGAQGYLGGVFWAAADGKANQESLFCAALIKKDQDYFAGHPVSCAERDADVPIGNNSTNFSINFRHRQDASVSFPHQFGCLP